MLCPRWDSNRIPALANTGNSRKHSQSGPLRLMYGPVRRPRVCTMCTPSYVPFLYLTQKAAMTASHGSSTLCVMPLRFCLAWSDASGPSRCPTDPPCCDPTWSGRSRPESFLVGGSRGTPSTRCLRPTRCVFLEELDHTGRDQRVHLQF
jgi:hypothetical protein